MIVINHAVLHIFNLNSGVAAFSDEELKVENSIETFLLNHIEKSFKSPKVQQGTF